MNERLSQHLRANAIAYLALFVALGGTSYAAINLPPGSVGNSQLKNHAVTPVKLNPKFIAGSVRAWAVVEDRPGAQQDVVASSDHATMRPEAWGASVLFHERFAKNCMPFASVNRPAPIGGFASAFIPDPGDASGQVEVSEYNAQGMLTPLFFNLMVVCATPAHR